MAEDEREIQIDALAVRPSSGEVFLRGLPLVLTRTEFRLLLLLIRSDGGALSRKQIIEAVRGSDYPVTERSLDSHVMKLRRKLGDHGRMIETVRGAGYRYRKESPACPSG